MTTARRALALAVTLTALAAPSAAVAKGGGGGGGTPAPPAPTVPPVRCDYSLDGPTADGGVVFSNQVGEAGCISVIVQGTSLRLYALALTPGWIADVTSDGGGSSNRVAVEFSNPATGQRAEARIEPGKTVIR